MGDARPVRAAPGSAAFLAIVDRAVPARPGHDHSRPMCAAWRDHERTRFFPLPFSVGVAARAHPATPPGWVTVGLIDSAGADIDFPTALAHDDPYRSDPRSSP